MTDFEAYQEYIQRKHNAFCKAVIRYAARDKILQLRRKWERQISLDYLMDEKFVQFAGPEPDEEYPFTVCGQTVLLCNAALAAALAAQFTAVANHSSSTSVNPASSAAVTPSSRARMLTIIARVVVTSGANSVSLVPVIRPLS